MTNVNGTVPVTVTWKEGGQIQKRTMQVSPGYVFEFGESNKKYVVSANNKKNAVLNLSKSEAYILLGESAANKKGDASKYQLDEKDWTEIKREDNSSMVDDLKMHTRTRSGSGAGYIKSSDITTGGKHVIIYGQGDEHRMSIFYNKK